MHQKQAAVSGAIPLQHNYATPIANPPALAWSLFKPAQHELGLLPVKPAQQQRTEASSWRSAPALPSPACPSIPGDAHQARHADAAACSDPVIEQVVELLELLLHSQGVSL